MQRTLQPNDNLSRVWANFHLLTSYLSSRSVHASKPDNKRQLLPTFLLTYRYFYD